MACFLVPAAEAVVTTIVKKKTEKDEISGKRERGMFSKRLNWLNNMLWGGSSLLAFEHIWHGEIVPWFPFLTNTATPSGAAEMLNEMAVSGIAMAVLVTAVWAGTAVVANVIEKRELSPAAERSE